MIQITENFGIKRENLDFFIPNGKGEKQIFTIKSPSRSVNLAIPPYHGPPKGGLLLTLNMGNVTNKSLCDLGTGYFALNPVAAQLSGARCAVGVEADPEVANWAKDSVKAANLNKVHIITASNLSDVHEKFDIIVGNLPIMPTYDKNPKNIYMYGGKTGWEVVDFYIKQITSHLNYGGNCRLLLFEFMGIDERTSDGIPSAFERLSNVGLTPRIVAKHNFSLGQDHPLKTNSELATYVGKMYNRYEFNNELTKIIVEGSLKS